MTRLDSTPSGREPQDEELARLEEEALVARRIAEALNRLDLRERHIVRTRFMDGAKVRLRDLGQHFGFSRERTRQIEMRSMTKLRDLVPVASALGWPVASSDDAGQ